MKSTKNIKLSLTKHAKKQANDKGFSIEEIIHMWNSLEARVVRSRTYPGQYRVCGDGICLVGVAKGRRFIVITCYADGDLTPPRPDQMQTEAGRKYAERYFKGKGRK